MTDRVDEVAEVAEVDEGAVDEVDGAHRVATAGRVDRVDGALDRLELARPAALFAAGDHRAGTAMRALAVFGVVVALVATVAAWQVLGNLERSVGESLEVGENATETLSDTIDVAAGLITSVDGALVTIGSTLDAVDTTVEDTAGLAATTASLAETLPASFDDIDGALATVETLSAAIDGALRAASRLPLGPDYDPAVALPDAVQDLRLALDPVGSDLRSIAGELESFADGSGELSDQIAALSDDVTAARLAVADSAGLLDDYRARADEAARVVVDSRDELRRSVLAARVAVVLIGLLILTGQYVPWWLGTRLRDASDVEIARRALAV